MSRYRFTLTTGEINEHKMLTAIRSKDLDSFKIACREAIANKKFYPFPDPFHYSLYHCDTSLFAMAVFDFPEAAIFMLDHIRKDLNDGYTAIDTVAKSGNISLAKKLIASGAYSPFDKIVYDIIERENAHTIASVFKDAKQLFKKIAKAIEEDDIALFLGLRAEAIDAGIWNPRILIESTGEDGGILKAPLIYFARENEEITKQLALDGANENYYPLGYTNPPGYHGALENAVQRGFGQDVIDAILSNNPELNSTYFNPLEEAIAKGNVPAVKAILDSGADPFVAKVYAHHMHYVHKMASKEVYLRDSRSILERAELDVLEGRGSIEILGLLRAKAREIAESTPIDIIYSSMQECLIRHDIKGLYKLIQISKLKGCWYPNTKMFFKDGETFTIAEMAKKTCTEAIILLTRDESVDFESIGNEIMARYLVQGYDNTSTPLYLSAIKALLDRGIDPNGHGYADELDIPHLERAILYGSSEIVKALLDAGANIKALCISPEHTGMTIEHVAKHRLDKAKEHPYNKKSIDRAESILEVITSALASIREAEEEAAAEAIVASEEDPNQVDETVAVVDPVAVPAVFDEQPAPATPAPEVSEASATTEADTSSQAAQDEGVMPASDTNEAAADATTINAAAPAVVVGSAQHVTPDLEDGRHQPEIFADGGFANFLGEFFASHCTIM